MRVFFHTQRLYSYRQTTFGVEVKDSLKESGGMGQEKKWKTWTPRQNGGTILPTPAKTATTYG